MLYRIKLRLTIVLLGLVVSHFSLAQGVETQLSSDHVPLDGVVNVTYVVKDANSATPDFSALQKDFTVLSTDYGSAVNIVNGISTAKSFYRLQLQPKKAGELILPSIQFGNLQSGTRKLVVNATSTNSAGQFSTPHDGVFLRAQVSSTTPYVQSQVFYHFKLYFRTQLRDPRIELPALKTVTFQPVGDGQNYQTRLNGVLYNVVEKTFVLFPQKAGHLIIPPISLRAMVLNETTNPFSLFSFIEPKPIALNTQGFQLTVRDIPANYPGSAWLPAQHIALTEEWSSNQPTQANMPVTRTVHIKAEGLTADQLPDLKFSPINGVSIYAERPKRTTVFGNAAVVSTYSQKITYIPSTAQSLTVAPLKLNWWNTQSDTHQVAQLPARTLQVTPVLTKTLPPVVVAAPTAPTNSAAKPFYTSFWFWVACSLLVVWVITLWVMLRKGKSSPAAQLSVADTFVMSEFTKACRSNDATSAHEQLLQWAKTKWPQQTVSLALLQKNIPDEAFGKAVQELELALYAKKPTSWNGESLLAAFVKVKKTRYTTQKSADKDLLPPLHPKHNV